MPLNSINKRAKASEKVTIVGAIVDFLSAIFKIIAGVVGNSGANLRNHQLDKNWILLIIPIYAKVSYRFNSNQVEIKTCVYLSFV
jgi:hypothetical protein